MSKSISPHHLYEIERLYLGWLVRISNYNGTDQALAKTFKTDAEALLFIIEKMGLSEYIKEKLGSKQ